MTDDDPHVRNNRSEQRYELDIGGQVAIAAYDRRDDVIAFTHTEVPEALAGQGIAGRLVKAALADVRAQSLKILPLCEYVAGYVDRHPEEQDLLATKEQGKP
jgi:predicted GNAT family acetyltransferase